MSVVLVAVGGIYLGVKYSSVIINRGSNKAKGGQYEFAALYNPVETLNDLEAVKLNETEGNDSKKSQQAN